MSYSTHIQDWFESKHLPFSIIKQIFPLKTLNFFYCLCFNTYYKIYKQNYTESNKKESIVQSCLTAMLTAYT